MSEFCHLNPGSNGLIVFLLVSVVKFLASFAEIQGLWWEHGTVNSDEVGLLVLVVTRNERVNHLLFVPRVRTWAPFLCSLTPSTFCECLTPLRITSSISCQWKLHDLIAFSFFVSVLDFWRYSWTVSSPARSVNTEHHRVTFILFDISRELKLNELMTFFFFVSVSDFGHHSLAVSTPPRAVS